MNTNLACFHQSVHRWVSVFVSGSPWQQITTTRCVMTQNSAVHSTYVFGVLQLPGDSLLFPGSGSAGLVPLLLRRSGEHSVLFWCLRAI